MADNYNDIKVSSVDAFLDQYSPRLNKVLEDNKGVSFSRFEILLPIILDNYKALIQENSDAKLQSNPHRRNVSKVIEQWLKNNGFVVDGKVTDKEITQQDMLNFAPYYCFVLYDNKLISKSSGEVGEDYTKYREINPSFFYKEREILGLKSDDEESVKYNFSSMISDLAKNGTIYPDNTDKLLRNLSVTDFNKADKTILGVDSKGASSYFEDFITKEITKSWNNLINKPSVVEFLKSIPEFSNQDWVIGNKDANRFYNKLKEAYTNNTILQKNEQIKNIIERCNPDSLLFLLQKIETTATKQYNPGYAMKPSEDSQIESVFAGELDRLRKVIKKLYTVSTVLDIGVPSSLLERIYDYELNRFIIPKNLEPIDPEVYKFLLQKEDINVTLDSMKQTINSLSDTQLNSMHAALTNDNTIKYLQGWFASALTQKVLADDYKLDITNKEHSFIKNYKSDLQLFKQTIEDYKGYIETYKTILKSILSGKFVFDSFDLKYGSKASKTDLGERTYAMIFKDKLKDLALFSKKNKYDINTINYNDVVNSNFVGKFVLDGNSLLSQLVKITDQNFSDLLLRVKDFKIDESIKKADVLSIYKDSQEKAGRLLKDLVAYVGDVLRDKLNAPKTTIPNADLFVNRFRPQTLNQSKASKLESFLKSINVFQRHAASQFTENDLTEFFNTLYNRNDDLLSSVLSKSKQTLLSDIQNIEKTALNIIKFLNLNSIKGDNLKVNMDSCLNQILNLSKDSFYFSILNKNIDLEFLQENKIEVMSAIYNILNSKNINYDTILNEILGFNKDLLNNPNLKSMAQTPLEKRFVGFLVKNNISNFDANNIINTIQTLKKTDPNSVKDFDINFNYIISFVAKVLFTSYVNSSKDNDSTSFQNYLANQQFNLLLDVCNTLSVNKTAFTDLIVSGIQNISDKDYLLNAQNKFNDLINQSSYKFVPENVVKMISNYKVLSTIRAFLFSHISNDSMLKRLLEGCTDWDFSDELINKILSFSKIYNISGDLIDGDIKNLKSNMTMPFEYKYATDSSFESKCSKIMNKLKNLNAYSINRNVLAFLKLLKVIRFEFGSMLKTSKYIVNTVTPKLENKFQIRKVVEPLSSNIENVETLVESIDELATKAIVELKPKVKDIVSNWVKNNSDISKFIKISYVFDRHKRGLFTKEFNVLPIDVEIDTEAVQKEVQSDPTKVDISILDRELQKMRFLISQHIYNSIIQSDLDSSILSGLDELLTRTDTLIEKLTGKINQEFKGSFITIPYIQDKVATLETNLTNQIILMCTETQKCFDLVQILTDKVSNIWTSTEKLANQYNIEI